MYIFSKHLILRGNHLYDDYFKRVERFSVIMLCSQKHSILLHVCSLHICVSVANHLEIKYINEEVP